MDRRSFVLCSKVPQKTADLWSDPMIHTFTLGFTITHREWHIYQSRRQKCAVPQGSSDLPGEFENQIMIMGCHEVKGGDNKERDIDPMSTKTETKPPSNFYPPARDICLKHFCALYYSRPSVPRFSKSGCASEELT